VLPLDLKLEIGAARPTIVVQERGGARRWTL
jgi:hypothetical protein